MKNDKYPVLSTPLTDRTTAGLSTFQMYHYNKSQPEDGKKSCFWQPRNKTRHNKTLGIKSGQDIFLKVYWDTLNIILDFYIFS